jgi:hypothetical protein
MILSEVRLREVPAAFRAMTGLQIEEFDALARDLVPAVAAAAAAEQDRRRGRARRRAAGGGHPFALSFRAQLLLTVIWLRVYPTCSVLGFLFGISHPTVLRTIARVLPILEQAGRDTMRLPGHGRPGRRSRRDLPELRAAIPELAVIVDTFEQRVQRPRDRAEADRYYSGKKKQHTLKTQLATERQTGQIVDVPDSVCGPTNPRACSIASTPTWVPSVTWPTSGSRRSLRPAWVSPPAASRARSPGRRRTSPTTPRSPRSGSPSSTPSGDCGATRRWRNSIATIDRPTPLASGPSPASSTDNWTTDSERSDAPDHHDRKRAGCPPPLLRTLTSG